MLQRAILSSGSPPEDIIVVSDNLTSGASNASAYPWSSSGYGVKYSSPSGSYPTKTRLNAVAVSPLGRGVVLAGYDADNTTPLIRSYKWGGSGFGTALTNPTLTSGTYKIMDARMSPDGAAIVLSTSLSTEYLMAYAWSDATGFGTKYSAPGVQPSTEPSRITFNHAGTSFMTDTGRGYPWTSASGFGTRYSNPATTLSGGFTLSVCFSNADDVLFFGTRISGGGNTVYLEAYQWSSSGYGTKYTNVTLTNTNNNFSDIKMSPYGGKLLTANDASSGAAGDMRPVGYVTWDNTTGFGGSFTYPATRSGEKGSRIAFSYSGSAVAIALQNSPYLVAYRWSSSGFGSIYSNPSSLPAGGANDVTFVPRI